jgi:hypothetical protein
MLRFFLIDFFDIFSKLKYPRIRKRHQNRGVGGDYKLTTVIYCQIFDQGEIANWRCGDSTASGSSIR